MDYGAKTLTLILITVSVTFDFSNSDRKSTYISFYPTDHQSEKSS